MKEPIIIRKRLIPFEEVDISSDEVLYYDDSKIITRWIPIKPRKDIGWGLSYTHLTNNYKISCFYDTNGDFTCWYCDIIKVTYIEDENKYIIKDLLVDLILRKDSEPEVLDIDELNIAFEQELINIDEKNLALETMDVLKNMIKENKFPPEDFNYEDYSHPEDFKYVLAVK